jgi:hypothetical protein
MFRKLMMSLTPMLAMVAFAVIPAVAQGAVWQHCLNVGGTGGFATHKCTGEEGVGPWNWVTIPENPQTKEQVKSHGALTFNVPAASQKITCQSRDRGFIWNEGGVGHDEVTEFVNTKCVGNPTCSPVAVVAKGLPWKTELFLEGVTIRDRITGVAVEVSCNVLTGIFKGTLTPAINTTNGSAEFGAGSGELEEPKKGLKGVVEGTDEVEQDNGWAVRPH